MDPLREQADERFTHWRKGVAAIYRRFGYGRAAAWDEAALVISAPEGAALMARAGRTIEPLDAVERLLVDRVVPPTVIVHRPMRTPDTAGHRRCG